MESVNGDKPYDEMAREMLAADEMAPEDPGALRATGFLARNYKMLSREQWMEDGLLVHVHVLGAGEREIGEVLARRFVSDDFDDAPGLARMMIGDLVGS